MKINQTKILLATALLATVLVVRESLKPVPTIPSTPLRIALGQVVLTPVDLQKPGPVAARPTSVSGLEPASPSEGRPGAQYLPYKPEILALLGGHTNSNIRVQPVKLPPVIIVEPTYDLSSPDFGVTGQPSRHLLDMRHHAEIDVSFRLR